MAPDPESNTESAPSLVESDISASVTAAKAGVSLVEAARAYSREGSLQAGKHSTTSQSRASLGCNGCCSPAEGNYLNHSGQPFHENTRPAREEQRTTMKSLEDDTEEQIVSNDDQAMTSCEANAANDTVLANSCLSSGIVEISERELEKLKMDPEVMAFYRALILEGRLEPGDSGVSLDSKPSWVDDEKIRLGQRFVQKYFFGVMFAEMSSLFLLFSVPGSLQSLIFSGNSDTPVKAFQRYLSTVERVCAWYSGDLWAAEGKARCNLRAVRQMHAAYRRRLNGLNRAPTEERARRTKLQQPPWTDGAADAVREDFAENGRAHGAVACPIFSVISSRHEWINQMEMSVTQFGFVALAVTFPERFGAGGASDEELDAFVHLWRVLGHLLGVQERFNFCAGGLDAVRKRSKALVRCFLAPALAQVDASWEHMTRCAVAGVRFYAPRMTYKVALIHLCETLGVETPRRLLQSLSARQWLQRRLTAWVLRWAPRIPPLRALINWRMRRQIQQARARADCTEWLREREERVGNIASRRSLDQDKTVRHCADSVVVYLPFTTISTIVLAAASVVAFVCHNKFATHWFGVPDWTSV